MKHSCGFIDECNKGSIFKELAHHLPHSILAVAASLTVVSFMGSFFGVASLHKAFHMLFHNFHFMHIVFAISSSFLMFTRYSNRIVTGLALSVITSSFFCVLSDVLLPYFGGQLLGANMKTHLCFFCDFTNISIFVVIGAVNGLAQWYSNKHSVESSSTLMHGFHITVSSLASTFYLVAHGFALSGTNLGVAFILLMVAVVLPCTLSDICVPIMVAKFGNKK